jgi:hypothetical protein
MSCRTSGYLIVHLETSSPFVLLSTGGGDSSACGCSCPPDGSWGGPIMDGMQGGLTTRGDWIAVPVVLFAPPVALGMFGAATVWALRGFTE